MTNPNEAQSLIPVSLAIKAMRDTGYRNTAYAIAELIDNAIQAQANSIELLCCEREYFVRQRTRRNIHKIGVLDNGKGMNESVLSDALQFGNGQYLNDRSGIGRFGMGLPSSSISQCRKLEVWTWQNGPDNALYSYIDYNEVESGKQSIVPSPEYRDIPQVWRDAGATWNKTGTLIVWSELDRCLWKTAKAIIKHSEYIIGRMYRRFIHSGTASIRMTSFIEETPGEFMDDIFAKVNDPLYIMVPSSTPVPYNQKEMFRKDGDQWEIPHEIKLRNGQIYTVKIRFTVAKEEARNRPNAGITPYGKHAKRNIGVSLIRAGRELELDHSLINGYDPRERWWGVEVEFPPELDEIFGVTNSKQSARHFTEIGHNIEDAISEYDNLASLQDQMKEDNDIREPLISIVSLIGNRLKGIRDIIKIQRKGTNKKSRYKKDTAEERGTDITRTRQEEGHIGESDAAEALPEKQRIIELSNELQKAGLSTQQANEIAAHTIGHGIKYTFATADLEGSNFFTIRAVAGEIVIKLNINHPAYENLVEVLEDSPEENLNTTQLLSRLYKANYGLKLLLMSWARFEDEAFPPKKKTSIQDTRFEWGQYAAQFLEDER